ncbi:MAG: cytochrome b, partial [Bosea sp. (in: a-proteobacteria)]
MAGFVLLLVFSGVVMKQLGEGALSMELYTLHKSMGALALVLVLARIVYRTVARVRNRWNKASGAHAVHIVLYVAMIVVPLFGWAGVSDFGARGVYFGFQLPMIWPEGTGYASALFAAHAYAAFGMLALVGVHIGIAVEDFVTRGTSASD